MDLLLTSNRAQAGAQHWSRALAERHAVEFAKAGHRVRWICALAAEEDAPRPYGDVEVIGVPGSIPSFRHVSARASDTPQDVALARALRSRPADVVNVIGFGAPGSMVTLWLARRMGSVSVATVRADELLCHRGTLVDEREQECRSWDDADRCTACCLAPTNGGLSPMQARLGTLLRWLGGRSPMPNRLAFVNRWEAITGGLQEAGAIVVDTQSDRELLEAAGVHSSRIRVGAWEQLSVDRVEEFYRALTV